MTGTVTEPEIETNDPFLGIIHSFACIRIIASEHTGINATEVGSQDAQSAKTDSQAAIAVESPSVKVATACF